MFWGPVTEVEVLKVEVQRWGSKSFASQRESGHSTEFPPGCGSLCLGMGFMVRLCLSLFYPFPWMVFVSVPLMCWSQSASFWISVRKISLCVAICSLYPQEKEENLEISRVFSLINSPTGIILKENEIPDHLACLLRVKKQQLELGMEQ